MLCSGIVLFFSKLQREGYRGSHTYTRMPCIASGKWVQAIDSRSDNQIVIFHFCFFVDCQTLSAVSRAAGRQGGGVAEDEERERESQPLSHRARVFLKQWHCLQAIFTFFYKQLVQLLVP